jgi:elongation factor Ts
MASISAAQVKELREKTGAGMMDCKAALSETAGDVEAAIDWLRKKGLARAAKKAGRIAAEGLIGIGLQDRKGVLVEVNSETDFVARNEQFQGLVRRVVNAALAGSAEVAAINATAAGDGTLADAISSAVATIGENITLRRAGGLTVAKGTVAGYMHSQVAEGLGKIGVLVALESGGRPEELAAFGRMVAMHVAASNPQALDASGLDPAVVAREREVLAERFRAQGKPENVLGKIVESGLKTYYKEVCLLEQAFVHDPGKSVAQALKEVEGKAGAAIRIAGFRRFALGEGIERAEADAGS